MSRCCDIRCAHWGSTSGATSRCCACATDDLSFIRRRFTVEDVAAIRRFGEPSWLVEATLMHDTFARQSAGRFPQTSVSRPSDLAKISGSPNPAAGPSPADWADEIEVLKDRRTSKNRRARLFPSRFAHPGARRLAVPFPGGCAWLAAVLCAGASCGCRGCLALAHSFG